MTALRTSAPAKVNLGLRITGRRPDGYHELRSVFLRLVLADEVTIADASDAADSLLVDGDPGCPIEGNLALRAASWFRDVVAAEVPPLAIRLRKRIPMEAGLAGGSSDAAAVLRLLTHRFPGALEEGPRAGLAGSLGSDVPFFAGAAGAALVSGTGESVEPLPPPIDPLGVLLVRPAAGLATSRVFAAWDALHDGPLAPASDPDAIDELAAELRAGASPAVLVGLAARLRDANDLWHPATVVEPRMTGIRDALEDRLGLPALMTGSGSTLVTLHDHPEAALDAAASLRAHPPAALAEAWVTASATGTPYPPVIDIEEEGA